MIRFACFENQFRCRDKVVDDRQSAAHVHTAKHNDDRQAECTCTLQNTMMTERLSARANCKTRELTGKLHFTRSRFKHAYDT